jgi:hypothetical protein
MELRGPNSPHFIFAVTYKWAQWNGALEKCKQFFEYQHLLLLGDIWWLE